MFSKNASNQSGVSVDTIQANNQIQLPSGAVISNNSDGVLTTTNQSIAGTKTFTGTILANKGYTLPSSTYSLNANAIGYINSNYVYSSNFINSGIVYNFLSLPMTKGIWFIQGQLEYRTSVSPLLIYSKITTSLSNNLSVSISSISPFDCVQDVVTSTANSNTSIIRQVSGIVDATNDAVDRTIYLQGMMNYSAGSYNVISTATTTTAMMASAITLSTTFTITSVNTNIQVGMKIVFMSGYNYPTVVSVSGTTITMDIAVSFALTELTFGFFPNSYLKAVRIG